MSRYYLLSGYIVPVYHRGGSIGPLMGDEETPKSKLAYYKRIGVTIRNYSLIKLSPKVEVKVVYYNVDVGHLLIKASSRVEAYSIANAIRGYFGVFSGMPPEAKSDIYYLQVLNRVPHPSWTIQDFLKALQAVNAKANKLWLAGISTGYNITEYHLKGLLSFLSVIHSHPDIREAMENLLESRFLFYGFMSGSYYQFHYTGDRKAMPRWELEKRYLENRYRYETAFLASFKGIERFFRNSNFKRQQIPSLFNAISYQGVARNTTYTRYYEIFLDRPKTLTYEEIIAHFLLLRNSVAAHGNRNPPKQYRVFEDSVFEIQSFLSELIVKAVRTYI